MQRSTKGLLCGVLLAPLAWSIFHMDYFLPADRYLAPVLPEAAPFDSVLEPSAFVQARSLPAKDETFDSSGSKKLLTLAEVRRLGSWMREQGYLFHIMEGGAYGIPSASGYEAMQDDALRQVAASGDRTAAFTLGQRLFDRYQEAERPKPKSDWNEAIHFLTQASVMGYTASLELLVQMAQQEARMSIGQRRDDPGISIELLSKAYTYTYLLKKRGDLTDGLYLQVAKQTKELSPEQDAAARHEADLIHAKWNARRVAMGMPLFEDGVPEDIRQLSNRVTEMYLKN